MSAATHEDAYTPEMKAQAPELTADAHPPMLREAYEALSPDGPEHFGTVFDEPAHTWRTEPSHEPAELERVSAPTPEIPGDDDVLTIGTVIRSVAQVQLDFPWWFRGR